MNIVDIKNALIEDKRVVAIFKKEALVYNNKVVLTIGYDDECTDELSVDEFLDYLKESKYEGEDNITDKNSENYFEFRSHIKNLNLSPTIYTFSNVGRFSSVQFSIQDPSNIFTKEEFDENRVNNIVDEFSDEFSNGKEAVVLYDDKRTNSTPIWNRIGYSKKCNLSPEKICYLIRSLNYNLSFFDIVMQLPIINGGRPWSEVIDPNEYVRVDVFEYKEITLQIAILNPDKILFDRTK